MMSNVMGSHKSPCLSVSLARSLANAGHQHPFSVHQNCAAFSLPCLPENCGEKSLERRYGLEFYVLWLQRV